MDKIFSENMQVITERWPQIGLLLERSGLPEDLQVTEGTPEVSLMIDGIHLSSCYNRSAEAALHASLVEENARTAWIYGFGLGDLPVALLARKILQKLHVVILNPAVARLSLSSIDHRQWLRDPRLTLSSAAQEEMLRHPFAAVPAELQLADEDSARLRDQVFLELATPFIRTKHHGGRELLQQRFAENRSLVAEDGDVASLFGGALGKTVMVAAGGPTLTEHFPWIKKKCGELPLIAVATAVKPLLQEGIHPDLVMVIDEAHTEVMALFANCDLTAMKDAGLVYFPRVSGMVLRLWPGNRYTAYPNHEAYRELSREFPRGILFSSGSVVHPAVDLAVKMGAAEVVLFGADFAYPNGMTHVRGSAHAKSCREDAGRHWVLNAYGQRIGSAPNLRGFLRDLEGYIGQRPQVRFINAGRKGALIEGTEYLEAVDGE